jgi:hypothetical protein
MGIFKYHRNFIYIFPTRNHVSAISAIRLGFSTSTLFFRGEIDEEKYFEEFFVNDGLKVTADITKPSGRIITFPLRT